MESTKSKTIKVLAYSVRDCNNAKCYLVMKISNLFIAKDYDYPQSLKIAPLNASTNNELVLLRATSGFF